VSHPAARVLGTLELLQAHGRLSGAEIARRLGVHPRTVRRYLEVLEQLGIPVTSERGRDGGYGLVAGFKLPPMMFTDEEALALSLGLAAARGLGLSATTSGLGSARAKLERVMPAGLRRRLRAADETMALELPARGPAAEPGRPGVEPRHLAQLSEAIQSQRAAWIEYRAADGATSERRVDPYGLAFRGGCWYLAGHCHLRGGVRHFRLDRIRSLRRLDARFERPADFDALAELTSAIARLPRAWSAEIRLETDLATAKRELAPTLGRLEPLAPERRGGDANVLLSVQTDDLDWLARELARIPFGFGIRHPPALRAALARHARRLGAAARPPARSASRR
jgi:predicted DNA-binding transcriptional regulator YafY